MDIPSPISLEPDNTAWLGGTAVLMALARDLAPVRVLAPGLAMAPEMAPEMAPDMALAKDLVMALALALDLAMALDQELAPVNNMINTCFQLFDLTPASNYWGVAADWLEDHGHPTAPAFRSNIYCLFDPICQNYLPGDGHGFGDGQGNGYGNGSGQGSGNGAASGTGRGSGSGWGIGFGSGLGNGFGTGSGFGNGSGYDFALGE